MPGRGRRCWPGGSIRGLEADLLDSSRRATSSGVLALDVQQSGGQLDEAAAGRVAVLAQQKTRSWSSTASTTAAPGCSTTRRRNGSASSGASGARTESARSVTTHPVAASDLGADDVASSSGGVCERVRPTSRTLPCRHERRTRQPDHDEARERAALIEVERYDIEVDLRGLLEGELWRATSTTTFTCRRPGADDLRRRRRRGAHGHAQRRAARPRRRTPTGGCRCPTWPPTTSSSSSPAQRDTGGGDGDPAHRRPLRRAWSTCGPPSSPTAPSAPGPASTSPTSRPRTASASPRPTSWTVLSATARPRRSGDLDDGARVWDFPDTPRLSTYVVVVNAGPFHEIREQRGDHSLGLWCRQSLRPLPRARRRGAAPPDRAGPGLLRRAVRPAVPAGALRPGLRARHGRGDGELGLRHLDRLRALPQPADLPAARRGGRRAAARDGAHVVRRPGDHAVVGRPVAQRGLRLLGRRPGPRSAPPPTPTTGPPWPVQQIAGYEHGHGPGAPRDPRRGARRRAGDGQLRRDHLRQGPGRPAPAVRLRRRGRLRRRPARPTSPTTPGATPPWPTWWARWPRLGPRPRALDGRLARPGRHRHHQPGRDHPAASPRTARAAPAPPRHRLLHAARRRLRAASGRSGRDRRHRDPAAAGCPTPTSTCSTSPT